MEELDFLNKLGIKQIEEFITYDEWFSYLINEYIPYQSEEDMKKFIFFGFNSDAYLIWKAKEAGLFSEELAKAVEKKIRSLAGAEEVLDNV